MVDVTGAEKVMGHLSLPSAPHRALPSALPTYNPKHPLE